MQVYNPAAFLLLLVIPVIVFVGLRSYDRATPFRKTVMTVIRCLVILLVVVDLLAIQWWWKDNRRRLCVYYLVDLSTSMDPYRQKLAGLVRKSLEEKRAGSWAGVIVFDAKPRVIVPASARPDIDRAVETIEGIGRRFPRSASAEEQETDIGAAIRLALSLFPSDKANRICLISDCNETRGNAVQKALNASLAGVDIVVLDPLVPVPPDIAVEQVSLTENVHVEEAFEARVSLISSLDAGDVPDAPVSLQLYRNHVLVGSQPVRLERGRQTAVFRQRIDHGGRYLYEARIVTPLAQRADNDRAYAMLEVKDTPRILVVANDAAERRNIRQALQAARVSLEIRPAAGLPATMLDLEEFAAVVLGNIPASEMTANQMKLLHDYVKEFGGSVILTGGDQALSAGGYAGTALEEMLPAWCSFEEKETPTSALAMVVDSSVSMSLHTNDFTGSKMTFVRRLFDRGVDVLSDRDRLGALGFGDEIRSPYWFLTLQPVIDRTELKRTTRIRFGDQSNLFRSLMKAYQKLLRVNATNKGILVVTDGYVAAAYDYPQIAMQMTSSEISISCIAVGNDANQAALRQMARWGNGRYYHAEDVDQAARLLEREIEEFSRSVVVEKPVEALMLKEHPVLSGVDISLSPTLFGYVRVKPKLAAETLLVARKSKDPLLLTWTYGAGRVTIFSTDVQGKWSHLWVSEWGDSFAALWQNLCQWTASADRGVYYVPRVRIRGWELLVDVDALDARNRFVNQTPPTAGIYPLGETGQVFSEESRVDLPMFQTGAGRYQNRYRVNRRGVYLVKVSRADGSAVATTGAIVSANRELTSFLPNLALRDKLCQASGGWVATKTGEVFRRAGPAILRPHDIGRALLLAAGLFFVLDVCVRRWPAIVDFVRRRRSS